MSAEDFRTWLSLKLEKHRMPQYRLGERTGYSAAFVSLILKGKRELTADFCIKAAEALGIDPLEALQVAGFVPSPSDDPKLVECWRLLNELSPDRLDCALAMLRGLAAD